MFTKLPNGEIIYEEDIECVVDGINGIGAIYIGNLEASQNPNTLKKYNIKSVLTSAKGVFLNHPKSIVPYYLHVPGEDRDGFDLSRYFPKSANFIKESLEKTNILVHCLAGVSRSVSLVIAYLIKYKHMTFNDAYHMIKARRKIIHPNDGFITQLKQYQRQCHQSPNQNFRGFSASPTKNHMKTMNHEKIIDEYPRYGSPAKKPSSPLKKGDYKYLAKFQASQSPSKRLPDPYIRAQFRYSPTKQVQRWRPNPERAISPSRNENYMNYKRNMNEELDEKIADIRRRYAEYRKSDERFSPRKSVYNCLDENQLMGNISLRKMTSDHKEDLEHLRRKTGLGMRRLNSIHGY